MDENMTQQAWLGNMTKKSMISFQS